MLLSWPSCNAMITLQLSITMFGLIFKYRKCMWEISVIYVCPLMFSTHPSQMEPANPDLSNFGVQQWWAVDNTDHCASEQAEATSFSFLVVCFHRGSLLVSNSTAQIVMDTFDWQLNIFCDGEVWMEMYYWAVAEASSPDVYNVLTKWYEAVVRAVVFLYLLFLYIFLPFIFDNIYLFLVVWIGA